MDKAFAVKNESGALAASLALSIGGGMLLRYAFFGASGSSPVLFFASLGLAIPIALCAAVATVRAVRTSSSGRRAGLGKALTVIAVVFNLALVVAVTVFVSRSGL